MLISIVIRESVMQIDGDNNIQVNGHLSLNIAGELPVSKKKLKKLIRKELDSIFKKTINSWNVKKISGKMSVLIDELEFVGQKNNGLYMEAYTDQLSAIEAFLKNRQKRACALFEWLQSEILKKTFQKMHVV